MYADNLARSLCALKKNLVQTGIALYSTVLWIMSTIETLYNSVIVTTRQNYPATVTKKSDSNVFITMKITGKWSGCHSNL